MRRFRSSVFHGREENVCMHENRHNAPKEKDKTEKHNRSLLNSHVQKKKKDPFKSTAHYMFYTPNPDDFHLSVFRR